MNIITISFLLSFLLFSEALATSTEKNDDIDATHLSVDQLMVGEIDQNLAGIAYSGGESFKYDVFYSGGIKIGEIFLGVARSEQCDDCYEISSTITSKGGSVHYLYPIEDVHTTIVKGKDRLPIFSEIWQEQGLNYKAHKIIHFDQKNHIVVKQKEGDPSTTFQLEGVVHNEFSSFLSSRVMNLEVGKPFLVPTFGDDKRNDVVVITLERSVLDKSLFGEIETLKVTPVLTFSGLYDKKGDTTVWYTDDECRVPVLIKSKIVIGSLTASLAHYQNPLCLRYNNNILKQ